MSLIISLRIECKYFAKQSYEFQKRPRVPSNEWERRCRSHKATVIEGWGRAGQLETGAERRGKAADKAGTLKKNHSNIKILIKVLGKLIKP